MSLPPKLPPKIPPKTPSKVPVFGEPQKSGFVPPKKGPPPTPGDPVVKIPPKTPIKLPPKGPPPTINSSIISSETPSNETQHPIAKEPLFPPKKIPPSPMKLPPKIPNESDSKESESSVSKLPLPFNKHPIPPPPEGETLPSPPREEVLPPPPEDEPLPSPPREELSPSKEEENIERSEKHELEDPTISQTRIPPPIPKSRPPVTPKKAPPIPVSVRPVIPEIKTTEEVLSSSSPRKPLPTPTSKPSPLTSSGSSSSTTPRTDSEDTSRPQKVGDSTQEKPKSEKLRKKLDSRGKKEKKKKGEEGTDDEDFEIEFDKSLFSYGRCKVFRAPEQLEGKYKVKTSNWNDRYLVLYCNYILYYESRGSKPKDMERPLGAIKLEQIQWKRVREFQERTETNSLIPRLISYDNCIEVPTINDNGKESMFLLQFDSKETTTKWRDLIRSQGKTIEAIKQKVIESEPKKTIETVSYKYPMNQNIKNGPLAGEEEEWIKKLKNLFDARAKYRKKLRRIQFFAEFYTPGVKVYIDWFVTSGGDSITNCLERELTDAEDRYVQGWKKEGTVSTSGFEDTVFEVSQDGKFEDVARLQQILKHKISCLKWYKMYMKEVYKKEEETFETELDDWNRLLQICNERADKLEELRKEEEEQLRQKMEEEKRQREEELRRIEEERRNDPFYDLTDHDDPFVGLTVVRF